MRCLIFVFWLSISSALLAKPLDLDVEAEAAILINADSRAILYEKNAYGQYHPASTTKIATALYALHTAGNRLDLLVTADRESLASISASAKLRANYALPAFWLESDGTHIGLKNEEKMALRDLLFGLLVASGNDAANVIAKEIGGTIPNFMKEMNNYLKVIGCGQTTFYNPHGLHHPKHLTTPYDMSLIATEALKHPLFREIVILPSYMRPKTNKQEPWLMLQTNHLVRKGKPSYYPKAIGLKTGYTSVAQHNLVAAAKDQDRTLIAVLFKCKSKKDSFNAAIKLFEAAFNQTKVERILLKGGTQNFVLELQGAAAPIRAYVPNDVTIQFFPAEEPSLHAKLRWYSLNLPVQKGQQIGEIQILTVQGQLLQTVPLLANDSVSATWVHWLKSFLMR